MKEQRVTMRANRKRERERAVISRGVRVTAHAGLANNYIAVIIAQHVLALIQHPSIMYIGVKLAYIQRAYTVSLYGFLLQRVGSKPASSRYIPLPNILYLYLYAIMAERALVLSS